MTGFPIDVNLQTGKVAQITSVERSLTNKDIVYVQFTPDLTTKDTDASMEDPQAYYKAEDLYRMLNAASKAAHKYSWPRELRLLTISIPLAIILFYMGIVGFWQAVPAGILIMVIPFYKRKKRVKIIRDNAYRLADNVIQGAAYKVLTASTVLDPLSQLQDGVWVLPTMIAFWRPKFWE